jgi:hypothetical protein
MLFSIIWFSVTPYQKTIDIKLKSIDNHKHGVYDINNNFIKFNDTLSLPKYVDNYVGYIDNGEVYHYREKLLTTEEEIIIYFGKHENITNYKNGPNYITKTNTQMVGIFWVSVVIVIIISIIRILYYLYFPKESKNKYKIIFYNIIKSFIFVIEAIFILVMTFTILNYILYVAGFFIGIPIIILCILIYSSIDDEINYAILKKIIINNKYNILLNNYNKLKIN